ncbi:hypothetical protein [Candidatus Marithrix sp. Canyon 246]|uniref:hypothetical protein n=1 Tax=Candidatus Marithrix sp. Canyon 246 TaxID=1827136 RepID=UPI000849ED8E|nr:hypothetical protein [Candidatus Marithrix sp. Canyon 246]
MLVYFIQASGDSKKTTLSISDRRVAICKYLLADRENLLMVPLQIRSKDMLEFVYAYTDLQAKKDKKIKILGGKVLV